MNDKWDYSFALHPVGRMGAGARECVAAMVLHRQARSRIREEFGVVQDQVLQAGFEMREIERRPAVPWEPVA